MTGSRDLIVIGAGPAGLAAAVRAAQRGFKVLLLERADYVGGMSASFELAGLMVDQGSQRLTPRMPPELMASMHVWLGDDLQERKRNSRIFVAGQWFSYPLRAGEALRGFSTSLVTKVARDSFLSPFRRARDDTYAGLVRARVGSALYDEIQGPLAEKLWGIPGDEISADQSRRQPERLGFRRIAARVLGQRRDHQQHSGRYLYPKGGFGQLPEAMAKAATDAGVDLWLNAEVDQIRVDEDGAEVSTTSGEIVSGNLVFSTVPLPVLARIARPAPSLASIESSTRLRYRSKLLVYIVHEGSRWTPYDSHDIPDPRTPILRISEPANYRTNENDPRDHSVLCVEIPCATSDAVWEMDDEELGVLVENTLQMTGLPPVKRTHTESRRIEQVYPIYEVGHEQNLSVVDSWSRNIRRVVTLGRQGLFVLDNVDQAIQIANDAVDAIGPDGRFDRDAWTATRERFARAGG